MISFSKLQKILKKYVWGDSWWMTALVFYCCITTPHKNNTHLWLHRFLGQESRYGWLCVLWFGQELARPQSRWQPLLGSLPTLQVLFQAHWLLVAFSSSQLWDSVSNARGCPPFPATWHFPRHEFASLMVGWSLLLPISSFRKDPVPSTSSPS